MSFKLLKVRIESILQEYPWSRDCPIITYDQYMTNYGQVDLHQISGGTFIQLLINKKIPSMESVSRYWRLIQKENPELRGINYGKRLGLQDKVKKDLKYEAR